MAPSCPIEVCSLAAEEGAGLQDGLLGRRERRVPPVAVDLPEVAGAGHLAAGPGDQRGEVLALVAQRVVLGGGDQDGREAAQPFGQEGRARWFGVVPLACGALLPVPRRRARVEGRRSAELVPQEAALRVDERVV